MKNSMVNKRKETSVLDISIIRSYLSSNILKSPVHLQVLQSVVSTNDYVLAHGWSAEQPFYSCIANQQTGGRGRNGAVWESPADANIYMSLGYHFEQFSPGELSGLSLACGVCVARMLRGMGLEAQLKWPNDILLDYRKLAGILIETRVRSGGVYVVTGLGMNVDMPELAAEKIGQPWIDLCGALPALDDSVDRNRLVAQLLETLTDCCVEYNRSGFITFLDDWHSFDILSGQQVVLKTTEGEKQAKVLGIDEDYGLRVEIKGVREVLYAADIKLKLSDYAND